MNDKLNTETALHCAGQIVEAIERIQARHGWSAGDITAVTIAAATEIIARNIGPTLTAELFREHGLGLAEEHERRSKH